MSFTPVYHIYSFIFISSWGTDRDDETGQGWWGSMLQPLVHMASLWKNSSTSELVFIFLCSHLFSRRRDCVTLWIQDKLLIISFVRKLRLTNYTHTYIYSYINLHVLYKLIGQLRKYCTELVRSELSMQASQVALVVKNLPANAGRCNRHRIDTFVGKIPWRRAQKPTPVFLPGESHGQRSPVGHTGHRVA